MIIAYCPTNIILYKKKQYFHLKYVILYFVLDLIEPTI